VDDSGLLVDAPRRPRIRRRIPKSGVLVHRTITTAGLVTRRALELDVLGRPPTFTVIAAEAMADLSHAVPSRPSYCPDRPDRRRRP
jgi:hypothetical protein